MKLKMKTSVLQSMLARSVKGASCNKMIPITGMLCIKLSGNVLTLITTDASSYLYVREPDIVGDDFEITVDIDVFAKLISRLTCEEVILSLENRGLHIVGNGNYYVDLPLDEEGELVKFPNSKISDDDWSYCGDVSLSTIKLLLTTAKPSLAVTNSVLCYTGYYCGDRVTATDANVLCGVDVKMFDEPALISSDMMDVLNVFSKEVIKVKRAGDNISFVTDDCVLIGKVMDCIGDYPIDIINSLIDQSYDSVCCVSKASMLQLLDRLILFVSQYDRNSINLAFTDKGLQVQSKRANSVEVIPYRSCENFKPFTCSVDVESFRTQIKACAGDFVNFHYGLDNAIKFVDGPITQVIALIKD